MNNSSLFGAKTPTATFSGFGSNTTTSQASGGLFGQNKSLFGQSTATTQSGFSFGTTNSVFGNQPQTATGFGFGNKTGFGALGNQSNSIGFGSSASVAPFGSSNTAGGIFSSNTQQVQNSGGGIFSANTQQIQNSAAQTEYDLFISSISQPSLYGDDRDIILSRWNQLQAMWGSGTGLSLQGKSIYTPENYLCRFKAVSFNQIPNCEDSDGYVSLLIKGPFKEVSALKLQIHEKLHQMLNSQIHMIEIEDIQPAIKSFSSGNLPQAQNQQKPMFLFNQPTTNVAQQQQNALLQDNAEYTDVFIKVIETVNGTTRFVSASTIASHFKNEPLKSKLESELNVVNVVAQISPNSKEISDYLNGPAPRGLDVEMWEKAKQQCANSTSLIPVPTIGMNELKARIRGQVEFAQAQLATIRSEAETLLDMKTKVIGMLGKVDQLKRKEIELSNRILKVLCTQEILSKQGYTLSADEEALKCSLDKLWNQIVGPFGVKSRLQEILSAPKGACSNAKINARLPYNNLNTEAMDELREYFTERQKSIKEMMTLIREDIACLNIIENV